MVRALEIVPFQCSDTSLSLFGIHGLQFGSSKTLHMAFDRVDALSVICEIGSVRLQANHPQRC